MFRVIEYFAKSLEIIENGIIRKLGYAFLFAFRSNYYYFIIIIKNESHSNKFCKTFKCSKSMLRYFNISLS